MDSFPAWMERVWDAWDVRVMVLFSLSLQIILIILGSRRKYVTGLTGILIRIIVWSAYLMADWVATVALGKLSKFSIQNNDSINPQIRELWAPLLLLHLGGPDTITAYSMEDNRLWLRHAVGLAVQVGVVIYIFLRCWTGSWFSILTFPMFVAGIIKYGERVWVLCSTNNEEPRENKQFNDDLDTLFPSRDDFDAKYSGWIRDFPGLEWLLRGFIFFYSYKPHIANYICGCKEMDRIVASFAGESDESIFNVIDFELGFMYDVLYTKAAIIYTRAGCILRSISFFCTVFVLLGFSIITKYKYSNVDVIITYLLLIGAAVLDIYAFILILTSDWAILWMTMHHKKPLVTRIFRVVAPLSLKKWKRWSNSMAQFNLLSFCLHKYKPPTLFSRILKFFGMDDKFNEYRCQTPANITLDLKQWMLHTIKRIYRNPGQLNKRGEWTLESCKDLEWTVQEDFDTSIIIWNIATDICYYVDSDSDEPTKSPGKTTKMLSDYMMYLLVKRPHMLSIATWRFMFKSTCKNIMKKFKTSESPLKNQCLDWFNNVMKTEPNLSRSFQSSHAHINAFIVANTLLEKYPNRWEIISGVWIEMLCYAATHCQVNHHAQELSRGGEFLTHVWLLLTNLNKTERSAKTTIKEEANDDHIRCCVM